MQSGSITRFGRLSFGVACGALALAACSQPSGSEDKSAETPAANDVAAAPAAAAPAAAVPVDDVATLDGKTFASVTGDAAKGQIAFVTCKTCHAIEQGVNKIGPSLHNVVGRAAGTVANFNYTPANKNSGITWTPEKLFQYLENPQRVVPGTKMTFAGFPDAQKRADVIAYLKAN
jgi:cytochrome c